MQWGSILIEQPGTLHLRAQQEEYEVAYLSPYAAKSRESRGRELPLEPCTVRTCYQRDRDRILHSKAFRRLKHKTQVFIAPEGDHYRTRLTHTLEVAQISKTIARALRLNEDLTEAIALGHDLGHTPFGHSGEHTLNELVEGGFSHNKQSLRVVEVLEPLNLTWEVRNGILHHTGQEDPETLEGQVVKLSDRIAYLNHDIDDALRAGILAAGELPSESHAERVSGMVLDTIQFSWGKSQVRMSPEMWLRLLDLRKFMFSRVYLGSVAKREEKKAQRLLTDLYHYFVENPSELAIHYQHCDSCPSSMTQHAVDYIAGMTDQYALMKYREIFFPKPWTLHHE